MVDAPIAVKVHLGDANRLALLRDELAKRVAELYPGIAKPPSAVQEPFTLTNDERCKRQLPASIVKMSNGSFVALPWSGFATFGASRGPEMYGVDNGDLSGTRRKIDLSQIDSIALGVLSDSAVSGKAGVNASVLAFGLPSTLHAVVASPFQQLVLKMPHAEQTMGIDEALGHCNVAWQPYGSLLATANFVPLDGLVGVAAARSSAISRGSAGWSDAAWQRARAVHRFGEGVS